MWRRPHAAAAAGLLIIIVFAAGCSSTREADVEYVAEQFHTALTHQDGAAACHLLSEAVEASLAQSEGDSCEAAILRSGLPLAGDIQNVDVYGTAAQVLYDHDVVFLADFPNGWKIIGAGCTQRAVGPYDCRVAGG